MKQHGEKNASSFLEIILTENDGIVKRWVQRGFRQKKQQKISGKTGAEIHIKTSSQSPRTRGRAANWKNLGGKNRGFRGQRKTKNTFVKYG